jgi:hypothetical protein
VKDARVFAGTLFAPISFMFALVTPPAPPPTALPGPEQAPEVAPVPAPPREDRTEAQRKRDAWLLSLEGALHAPSDVGVQATVEFPFRLRLSTGFGFMPVNWLTGFIANATSDEQARAVLELPSYSGTIWRAQAGFRPFRQLGLYLDGGYARATIHGSYELGGTLLGEEVGNGSYTVDTSLDIWLLELGYQWQIAHRGVIALGLGVMSTFNADTGITATEGAPGSSEFVSGARRADDALESYGTLPFVTLRFGVDLL